MYPIPFSSLAEVNDYEASTVSVIFSPRETTRSISVEIVDDMLWEHTEWFFERLSTVEPRVTLDPNQTTVYILDNDICKFFQ